MKIPHPSESGVYLLTFCHFDISLFIEAFQGNARKVVFFFHFYSMSSKHISFGVVSLRFFLIFFSSYSRLTFTLFDISLFGLEVFIDSFRFIRNSSTPMTAYMCVCAIAMNEDVPYIYILCYYIHEYCVLIEVKGWTRSILNWVTNIEWAGCFIHSNQNWNPGSTNTIK